MPGFDLPSFDLVIGGWVYHNEYTLCEIMGIFFMPSVALHNLKLFLLLR